MTESTVFILSGRPDHYRTFLKAHGLKSRFFNTVDALNRALVDEDEHRPLLLDVRLVMGARPVERDRLFALSRGKPFMRTVTDNRGMRLLDEPLNLHDGVRPRRTQARATVRMEALFADFSDPFMTSPAEAVVLDISLGGCFLHIPYEQPGHDYVHLKILEMATQRPIHCAVRWRRTEPSPGLLVGVGLKFIDITTGQSAEIEQILDASRPQKPTQAIPRA